MVAFNSIVTFIPLVAMVAFNSIVTFIPLVALLTSPVMWLEEHF
jgi:hypothetical protein